MSEKLKGKVALITDVKPDDLIIGKPITNNSLPGSVTRSFRKNK